MPIDCTYRAATEADLDRLVELELTAYPSPQTVDAARRGFVANPYGALADVVVAEVGGIILGQAFLYPLEAHFGARRVKVGGVAFVAVAPEARGRGVASSLMRRLHVLSDVRGDAITMLYPFREGFYARLGYGAMTPRKRLAFDPGAIPAAWRELATTRIRGARGDDRPQLESAHEREALRQSGWITRSRALWDRRLARERRIILVCDAKAPGAGISGYIAFELDQAEPHAETTLVVDEIVADDDLTRRTLWGAVGAMRDQVACVTVQVAYDDPLERALIDADRRRFGSAEVEHELGLVTSGPMVRLTDVPRALEARGYAADGGFDVVVREDAVDGAGGDDELAVSLTVTNARAVVGAARGGGALRTTRAGLAAIVYGGLSPSDAARIGVVRSEGDEDDRVISRADAVLALKPVAPVDHF